MRIQFLPSTIDSDGKASDRQHLMTVVVDDCIAVDAGCLAMSCSDQQRESIRDVILTHPHLDHIAGLPIFIDDLFAQLKEPIRIHATREMIEILERDIFNWAIYPRFSELSNEYGPVVEYIEFDRGSSFEVKHLRIQSVAVNHKISANGFVLSDEGSSIAITGDTAETDEFWRICNSTSDLAAIFVECAFPNEMSDLSIKSQHLSPDRLRSELQKVKNKELPIYIINLKPMYRDSVIEQLIAAEIPNLNIMKVGNVYTF